ncbi:MAG TPA: NADP-dependent phosphogluconate dehydrogenase [Abditibacteriaceae bacterium]|nr:NADP-dependent phosphogluconate dehydrogenase [Abditibacteriaceae bacterium]
MQCDIGLIGLAVMGENLVLNMESKGFSVAVFNRTTAVTQKFAESRAKDKRIVPAMNIQDFISSLATPRKVMIMVKAGAPVDAVISQIVPLLSKGDLIIDGGNSLYTDTVRREKELKEQGLFFMGAGVSGGEEGALHGPSIMPGGDPAAYALVEPIFTKIAAQIEVDGVNYPCCTYIGPNGAGHYVKMVHNGIEYGDMQLICEAYDLLHRVLGMNDQELHDTFAKWNQGELESFLIEITRDIFARRDDKTEGALVDMILDKAGQKGTGKWTIMSALDLGVVASTINSAVEARTVSSMKAERVDASKVLPGPTNTQFTGDREAFIESVHNALYASKIVSYAQGLALMKAASDANDWELGLGSIAAIWRGGCIIRARFLDRITEAYGRNSHLKNLMLDPFFTEILTRCQDGWRETVAHAQTVGVPVPAFGASLNYYDSYRSERLPHNLLQAQRDYFGAHTYERTDEAGSFHTDWTGQEAFQDAPPTPAP